MKDAMKALRAHAEKPASKAHGRKAKFDEGGVTNASLKDMGRNMARVGNQGPVGRKGK